MKAKTYYPLMLLAALTVFTSCSKDDETIEAPKPEQSQAFFNLNVGSEWTYKRYENSEAQPDVLAFSGDTDRVTVESTVESNGLTYSMLKHTISNTADSDVYIRFEYARVDAAGHLVSMYSSSAEQNTFSAVIVHPGADSAYTASARNPYGAVNYSVASTTSMTVEGKSYDVVPYIGVFTPTAPGLTGKTISSNYAPGIGLVQATCRELNGSYYYEDRLVSYHLAQ